MYLKWLVCSDQFPAVTTPTCKQYVECMLQPPLQVCKLLARYCKWLACCNHSSRYDNTYLYVVGGLHAATTFPGVVHLPECCRWNACSNYPSRGDNTYLCVVCGLHTPLDAQHFSHSVLVAMVDLKFLPGLPELAGHLQHHKTRISNTCQLPSQASVTPVTPSKISVTPSTH